LTQIKHAFLGVSYGPPVPDLSISYVAASHDRLVDTLLPMNAHSRHPAGPQKRPPYRITLVEHEWHVTRPNASLSHAFAGLEQAEIFVRNDSGGKATFVEIVAEGMYMVKQLQSGR
jgi:hypothetical protein